MTWRILLGHELWAVGALFLLPVHRVGLLETGVTCCNIPFDLASTDRGRRGENSGTCDSTQ